jgi:hypothetical protein
MRAIQLKQWKRAKTIYRELMTSESFYQSCGTNSGQYPALVAQQRAAFQLPYSNLAMGGQDGQYLVSVDLNLSNRPVRTRTPGGVAGEERVTSPPYAVLVSEKFYDWLGPGVYFWENDPIRAFQWARLPWRNIKTPSILGAVIDLGRCLDLTTQDGIEAVKSAHKGLVELHKMTDEPLPQNLGSERMATSTRPASEPRSSASLNSYVLAYHRSSIHTARIFQGGLKFQPPVGSARE